MKTIVESYLLTQVRGYYKTFDLGHDTRHFDEVYDAMKRIVDDPTTPTTVKEKRDILLIAAAYHDTGMLIERERHEMFSVSIFENDRAFHTLAKLCREDIALIKTIISEHRSKAVVSTELSYYLKDADKVSGLTESRTVERVVGYHMKPILDEINQGTWTLDRSRIESVEKESLERIHNRAKFHGFQTEAARHSYKEEICIFQRNQETLINNGNYEPLVWNEIGRLLGN